MIDARPHFSVTEMITINCNGTIITVNNCCKPAFVSDSESNTITDINETNSAIASLRSQVQTLIDILRSYKIVSQ